MMSMLVPPWLESLLSTEFFSFCATHKHDAYPSRSECNMFCLDCHDDSFCFYCRSTRHKDHRVVQIRRSSYHDVVRVAEIEKVLDIRGVQTYVINSAKVLFLNERPQPKIINNTGKGSTPCLCEVCSRSLLDPAFRFCSLGCKLAGMKKNGDLRFVILSKKPDHEITGRREIMPINRRLPVKEDDHDQQLRESNIQQNKVTYQSKPSQPDHNNSKSRRRKGIPRRAPLGP